VQFTTPQASIHAALPQFTSEGQFMREAQFMPARAIHSTSSGSLTLRHLLLKEKAFGGASSFLLFKKKARIACFPLRGSCRWYAREARDFPL